MWAPGKALPIDFLEERRKYAESIIKELGGVLVKSEPMDIPELKSDYSNKINTEVNVYEYNGVYYIIDYAWTTFPVLTISRHEDLKSDYFEYRPFQSSAISDEAIRNRIKDFMD